MSTNDWWQWKCTRRWWEEEEREWFHCCPLRREPRERHRWDRCKEQDACNRSWGRGRSPLTRCEKRWQRKYFTSVEFSSLVQRLENNLFSRKSLFIKNSFHFSKGEMCSNSYSIIERRLDGVEIMSSDGNKVTTTTNIEMQLILKIKEASNEHLLWIDYLL